MDESWASRLEKWKEAPGAVFEQGKKGFEFLRSSIGSLPFFAATSVDAAEGNPERDETHYFLVPDPMMTELARLPEWWLDRDQRLTMGVVAEVVDHPAWEKWLESVRERMEMVAGN